MRLVVLSTFDVMPVLDGGRARYVNIYRHIADQHDVTIIAYDRDQNERSRAYQIKPRLKVIVPKIDSHDAARFWEMLQRTNRLTHDVLCIREYKFSPEFHQALQSAMSGADAVIAAHPYLAPVAFGYANNRIVKIYEGYNVEFDAKTSYFQGTGDPAATRLLLEDVRYGEGFAAREADYVTALSLGDADRFVELYGIPRSKIAIVPSGVDVASCPSPNKQEKQKIRNELALGDRPLGVFIGSAYAPNVDAYLRTRSMLAEAGYSGTIALIGTLKDGMPSSLEPVPFEERWLGFVDEKLKAGLISAADFALQLIFSGAGVNTKIFDYMAARTLIVGNSFGRRGVSHDGWFWPAETSEDLRVFVDAKPWDSPEGDRLAARARSIVETEFDWRTSAIRLERLLTCGSGSLWTSPNA